MYPHHRVAIATSTAGSGSAGESGLSTGRDDRAGRRLSLWRTIKWLGGGAILALAGWTAVQIAEYCSDRFVHDHPAPIEAQLRSVLVDASKDGYRAVSNRLVDLDGDGTNSRLILLRMVEEDRDAESSDELRIYDVDASRLKLTFSFRPLAPLFAASPRAGWPDQPDRVGSYDFQLTDARDLDGNGTVEPILQVVDHPPSGRPDPYQKPPLTRPFMLYWDFGKGRYRFVPLITENLGNGRKESIDNTRGESSPETSAVDAIAVRTSHEGPLLAAAFSEDAGGQIDDQFQLRQYRVRLWHLYPDGLGIPTMPCRFARPDVRVSGYTAALAINDALSMPRMC